MTERRKLLFTAVCLHDLNAALGPRPFPPLSSPSPSHHQRCLGSLARHLLHVPAGPLVKVHDLFQAGRRHELCAVLLTREVDDADYVQVGDPVGGEGERGGRERSER